MAARFPSLLLLFFAAASTPPALTSRAADFSILDYARSPKLLRGGGGYTPPPPPPPSPPPHPPPLTCDDLKGIGSLSTTCELNSNLNFTDDVYIEGRGNFYVLQGVELICPIIGCSIVINVTGEVILKSFVEIVAGSVYIVAGNASVSGGSLINATARAGLPPEPATGTPDDAQGGGGGHGGRGASCVMDNKKLPEEIWGGDAYAWESLDRPWSYGSKGGTTKREEEYGGGGGGRIWLEAAELIEMRGTLLADGGDGGIKGGGGSGGSIYITSKKM